MSVEDAEREEIRCTKRAHEMRHFADHCKSEFVRDQFENHERFWLKCAQNWRDEAARRKAKLR